MRTDLINKHKRTLEDRLAGLLETLGDRDSIRIQKSPDLLDEIQLASERDFAIENLSRDYEQLERVQSALKRIENGRYGVCLSCTRPIPERRLEAVPWAEYCVPCQELADESGGQEAGLELLEER